MCSRRFDRTITVTQHARYRMTERNISESLLLDLIDTGEIRYKDATRLWIAKYYSERDDNLLCAAVTLETELIIKTVMHHFAWESGL